MENLHNYNSYDTSDKIKRVLMDKLFLGTNIYFVIGYVKQILKAAYLVKKGQYTKKEWENSSLRITQHVERCGGKIHIRNIENLSKCDGPIVFVGNHMSVLETFALPFLISKIHKTTFVVKESLVTHPIFGTVMKSRDPIVVGRKNPREDFKAVMEQGKEKLKNGISIIVFPQSSRTVEFIPENFNTIGIKLAKAAGVKVIPIALKTDFWSNGRIIKDFGKIYRDLPIYIKFGEPMDIKGNGKAEHNQIIEFIKENLNEWNKI
ncbi:MAG: lysophospholipid acyltransferase family protein [Clostridiales bacterium]